MAFRHERSKMLRIVNPLRRVGGEILEPAIESSIEKSFVSEKNYFVMYLTYSSCSVVCCSKPSYSVCV